jgi:hypothetical protein
LESIFFQSRNLSLLLNGNIFSNYTLFKPINLSYFLSLFFIVFINIGYKNVSQFHHFALCVAILILLYFCYERRFYYFPIGLKENSFLFSYYLLYHIIIYFRQYAHNINFKIILCSIPTFFIIYWMKNHNFFALKIGSPFLIIFSFSVSIVFLSLNQFDHYFSNIIHLISKKMIGILFILEFLPLLQISFSSVQNSIFMDQPSICLIY